ncbi:MAG: hypothetical protein ABIY55_18910 [Kofleriaceae bacterium]
MISAMRARASGSSVRAISTIFARTYVLVVVGRLDVTLTPAELAAIEAAYGARRARDDAGAYRERVSLATSRS